MRIFKNRWFARFADDEGIEDAALCEAVGRAEQGTIDANLGGGVIKQRMARAGGGKSGGYRTFILYRKAERAFFVFAFPKSERENIDKRELAELKDAAEIALAYSDADIAALLKAGKLQEVKCDGEEISE